MRSVPKKLGRYNIVREVGRGSMGIVYKAQDPVIEREVAIKAIHLAFAVSSEEKQMYLNRFYREAKAAGKLSHPNIVTIYDVNEDKETGIPFLVMEYLEGTTLQEIIADGILLPLEDVNCIMTQMADALNYAHKQGVVHRDIKSANIILVEGMKPKITDFGIARMSTSDLTKSGQFMGTPNYMAPEQIDGKAPVDGRTDLFALGVIFYLLLTGERPFSGDSFTAISYKIVHVDPPMPRTLNPAVPEAYNRILGRLLAKDPNQRYKCGADLAADLRKISAPENGSAPINGVPVESTAPGAGAVAPGEEPPPEQLADERESIASAVTIPSGYASKVKELLATRKRKAIASAGAALIVLIAGLFYLHSPAAPGRRPAPPRTNNTPSAAAVPDDEQEQQPQQQPQEQQQPNTDTKLDLAMNYYRNGFYSKSIDLFEEVLTLDPKNPEAIKYLQLARDREKYGEGPTQPVVRERPPAPAQPQRASPKQLASQAKTKTSQPQAKPPVKQAATVKDSRIEFELDHPFPSGNFYIYLGNELLYQGALSAKTRKLFVVPVRSGKLTGSVGAPSGEVHLLMRLNCPDQSVSVEKESVVKLQKGSTAKVHVKYVTVSKQLEVRWL